MNTRVMIVDDDEDLRDALCDALADEGYDTIAAGDGEQALAELRRQPTDVILLDLMMPKMNGWQFRAAMHSEPTLAGIPVIVMTAASQVNGQDELAAHSYLQKPVSLATLLDAIEQVQRDA